MVNNKTVDIWNSKKTGGSSYLIFYPF